VVKAGFESKIFAFSSFLVENKRFFPENVPGTILGESISDIELGKC